jgi:pimeloyl-ACP methyl ester carboxylesterase
VNDTTSESNFDIEILAERLHYVLSWVEQNPDIRELPLGLCGEGRHAGAALIVGAKEPKKIRAIVARAGRPDLAESYLSSIQVPVLLVVGGYDDMLVHLNEKSHRELRCIKEILILAYASHSFTESGAMEEFADIARSWFNRHLANSEEQIETEIPVISFVDPEI